MEGELLRGLPRVGAVGRGAPARVEVASRTDRGVSARANVLALSSDLEASALLDRLNAIDPRIFFTGAKAVPEGFRVRAARERTYRYFEAVSLGPLAARSEAAALFSGKIDVRSFGRGIPASKPSWRPIDGVSLASVPGGEVIEVRAPAFVWGMVRKIVGALREVGAGRLSAAQLRAALEGRLRLNLPLAEPEPLVLWEVDLGVTWSVEWSGPSRSQQARQINERNAWWVRGHLLGSLPPFNPAVTPTQGRAPSGEE